MSSGEQWQSVLNRPTAGGFTLAFQRLGVEAECRPLSAAEVGECCRIGGERGLRYALYLSCDALRQAGDALLRQGAVLSPFDITERLSYADAMAAGGEILRRSGAAAPEVTLWEPERDPTALALPEAKGEETPVVPLSDYFSGAQAPRFPAEHGKTADNLSLRSPEELARVFADQLAAAASIL